MMNRNEKLEIAKRLRLSKESELSRYDLEQMLEAELTKPDAEIDTELVQQILELLEESPSQEQKRKSWEQIDKKLSFRKWRPIVSGLARIAAVGVILVALMFATYGTAQALNWEFLLRWMRPFAETFMIYSGDDPVATPEPKVNEVYSDTGLASTQAEFTSLADCPDKIDGYPAKPVWMPERFTYFMGSMYSDVQVTAVTHIFKSDAGRCIIDISKFRDNKDASSYHFEQLPDEISTMYVAHHQVAFYYNTDEATITASWLVENTNYFITGAVSQEEIVSIVESMMK